MTELILHMNSDGVRIYSSGGKIKSEINLKKINKK